MISIFMQFFQRKLYHKYDFRSLNFGFFLPVNWWILTVLKWKNQSLHHDVLCPEHLHVIMITIINHIFSWPVSTAWDEGILPTESQGSNIAIVLQQGTVLNHLWRLESNRDNTLTSFSTLIQCYHLCHVGSALLLHKPRPRPYEKYSFAPLFPGGNCQIVDPLGSFEKIPIVS